MAKGEEREMGISNSLGTQVLN